MDMDITVVICTYNRADSLRRTLRELVAQRPPEGVAWELLVVNNGSTDDTGSVCTSFKDELPLRAVPEPRQGKSRALNRAIQEARGNLVLFTDDDVDVEPDWIAQYWEAALRHPDAAFFGGRIVPRWEGTPPRWLAAHHNWPPLMGVAVSLDNGDIECPIDPSWPCPFFFGANLAMRREVLLTEGLRFQEDIGPSGRAYSTHEDVVLQEELLRRGHAGIYVPGAIVHHRNSADRMTERHVRAWHKGRGRSEVKTGRWPLDGHRVFGAPAILWRELVMSAIAYGITRFTRPPLVWLTHEARMARRWGSIAEFRRDSKAVAH